MQSDSSFLGVELPSRILGLGFMASKQDPRIRVWVLGLCSWVMGFLGRTQTTLQNRTAVRMQAHCLITPHAIVLFYDTGSVPVATDACFYIVPTPKS